MARTTPVGVEIDERVLVAVDLRGECERARRSGQWRGRGGTERREERREGGEEGRRDGRTMSRSWETEVTSMIIVVIVVVGSG